MHSSLTSVIQQLYEEKHPNHCLGSSKKASRKLLSKNLFLPLEMEVFVSGSKRYKYEHYYLKMKKKGCPLCYSEKSIVYKNRLAITADDNPFFFYHMLLRSLRFSSFKKETVSNKYSTQEVKKENFLCREVFSRTEIKALCHLAVDTKDYYITQAMRNSGASIPEHIHAHLFPQNETTFPLLNLQYFSPFVEDRIWINRTITYAMLFQGSEKEIANFFNRMNRKFNFPANYLIFIEKHLKKLVGIYIPRTQESPFIKDLAEKSWKFGVFEVLGLFDAKSADIYEQLTFEKAADAISQVTVQDINVRKQIEEECLKFTEEHLCAK